MIFIVIIHFRKSTFFELRIKKKLQTNNNNTKIDKSGVFIIPNL